MNIENFKIYCNGKEIDDSVILGEEKGVTVNMILYTDGSVKPSSIPNTPGVIGSAWHGYFYEANASKTKTSDTPVKGMITTIGYISEANFQTYKKNYLEQIQVAPLGYIDGVYSDSSETGWSNMAEINAMKNCLYTIIDFNKRQSEKKSFIINSVNIKSDSSYVLKLVEGSMTVLKEHMEIFKSDTCKEELCKIFNSYMEESVEHIITFVKIIEEVKTVVPEIIFEKVLGHSGDIGNDRADILCKMARNNSEENEDKKICRINYVTSYIENGKIQDKTWKFWRDKIDWDPMYNFKEVFYVHNEDNLTVFKDEEGTEGYFITVMNYPKKIEHGQKAKEPLFGIVFTPNIDKRLITTLNSYEKKAKDKPVLLIAIDLKVIGSSEHMKFEEILKDDVWTLNKRHQLLSMDDVPAVYPIVPPGLAKHAYDLIRGHKDTLGMVLFDIVKHNKTIKDFYVKDITDAIYKKTEKGREIIIDVKDKYIKIDMDLEEGNFTVPIEFTTDVIDRNSLKKYEKTNTNIYLVCKKENVGYYSYYTIVHNKDDGSYALYCNLYSSKIFIPKEKRKKKK